MTTTEAPDPFSITIDQFWELNSDEQVAVRQMGFELLLPEAVHAFTGHPEHDWLIFCNDPPQVVYAGSGPSVDPAPIGPDTGKIFNRLWWTFQRQEGVGAEPLETVIASAEKLHEAYAAEDRAIRRWAHQGDDS